jgi:hypothetical protein
MALTAKVRSCALPLLRVRLKLNVVPDAPLSEGTSLFRVMSPATDALTSMVSGSALLAPAAVPVTLRFVTPSGAESGTVTSRETVALPVASVSAPFTTYPPPPQSRGPVLRRARHREGDLLVRRTLNGDLEGDLGAGRDLQGGIGSRERRPCGGNRRGKHERAAQE